MIYQALIRFENYQPAFLQIRVKELCEAAEAWAKAAEKPAEPPSLPPTFRKFNCNVSVFFHDRYCARGSTGTFSRGTWTGSKRIQGLQGGARALCCWRNWRHASTGRC